MTVCGIIAEYNPFHNGHLYHMEKSRQLSGADYIIVVLSGSFVQRGAPAFVDKYMRTRMALEAGADLVIELPALFSCGSAEDFAGAGVSLLDQLGVTDYLSFGAETENPEYLSAAARILAKEPSEFSTELNRCLKEGLSFPKAREAALKNCFSRFSDAFGSALPRTEKTIGKSLWTEQTTTMNLCTEQISAVLLSSPNNILALEYLKALYRRRSSIKPIAVTRTGAGYHSTDPGEHFCSAAAVRAFLTKSTANAHKIHLSASSSDIAGFMWQSESTQKTKMIQETEAPQETETAQEKSVFPGIAKPCFLTEAEADTLSRMLPSHSARLLTAGWQRTCPVLLDDFSSMLAYQLLACRDQGYTRYLDVSEELSRRILRHALDYRSFTAWAELLKTKQYTYTRISRALCHILLQISQETADLCRDNGYTDYARVLGFRKNSAPLLSAIKKNSSIPLVTKMADADAILSPMGKSVLRTELFASQLYGAIQRQKFPSCLPLPGEYTAGVMVTE